MQSSLVRMPSRTKASMILQQQQWQLPSHSYNSYYHHHPQPRKQARAVAATPQHSDRSLAPQESPRDQEAGETAQLQQRHQGKAPPPSSAPEAALQQPHHPPPQQHSHPESRTPTTHSSDPWAQDSSSTAPTDAWSRNRYHSGNWSSPTE